MSNQSSRPFPVGFEERLILECVKNDDRVVYLNSCACLPLHKQLLGIVGADNIRKTNGTHESIQIEDKWASLLIGQCVLDEFHSVPKALSEISRVLSEGGTAMLSGPVSRKHRLEFERPGRPAMLFLPLKEIETKLSENRLRLLQVHDLTREIKAELRQDGRGSSILDFETAMKYVLVRATKET